MPFCQCPVTACRQQTLPINITFPRPSLLSFRLGVASAFRALASCKHVENANRRRNDGRDASLSREGIRDSSGARSETGRGGDRLLVRFPEFQSRTRRVAGKPRHAHRRSLIERFPDSSSNPESGPNSPPTVNNSQASPTAAANAAAAIQEVSVYTMTR